MSISNSEEPNMEANSLSATNQYKTLASDMKNTNQN